MALVKQTTETCRLISTIFGLALLFAMLRVAVKGVDYFKWAENEYPGKTGSFIAAYVILTLPLSISAIYFVFFSVAHWKAELGMQVEYRKVRFSDILIQGITFVILLAGSGILVVRLVKGTTVMEHGLLTGILTSTFIIGAFWISTTLFKMIRTILSRSSDTTGMNERLAADREES